MTDYFTQIRLTPFELAWKFIVFTAITTIAIVAPFSYSHDFFNIEKWQLILDAVISLVFFGDAFYNYRERSKKKKNAITLAPVKLTKFDTFVDFFSIIPFDVLNIIFALSPASAIFHLFRLLNLFKIIKIYNLLEIYPGLILKVKVFLIFIWSSVALHWIACGWIIIHISTESDLLTLYNKSLYWAVTTITTIGYGDITPSTNFGRLYTMVIMILGLGVYGIVIGNVSKMIYIRDRHKEQTREKISDITLYMRHYNIPLKLQRDVFSFYNHLFTKRLSESDSQIIGELPNALQNELQVFMNLKLIQNLPLFQQCKLECIKEVASCLEQLYFVPGQRIINKGEIGDEMYIISHGSVEIKRDNGQIVNTLQEGQSFGEIALIQETTRTFNVRSITYCDVYKFNKEDFVRIVEKHPQLLKTLERTMRKRSSDR